MRLVLFAAVAAILCHASATAAQDRPTHDPAIEAAAIAILQKKLPDIRKSHDIAEQPAIVRGADDGERPQGISALIDLDKAAPLNGRIIWI